MPRYETYSKVREIYNISSETVRNWARRGQIRYKCVQNPTRKTWLFDLDSIGEFLQAETTTLENNGNIGVRIIYLRIPSEENRKQLERDETKLRTLFPDAQVITDIGAGTDPCRSGFASLVQQVCRDQVAQVVVTSKVAIGRFLWDVFALVCKEHGCTLMVQNEGDINCIEDVRTELFDLVSSVLSSHQGSKGARVRLQRKEKEERDEAI